MQGIALNRLNYPVTTLGYGKRLGVWFQGCSRACQGCISPETQPYSEDKVPIDKLLACIPHLEGCDGLTVSGGEPFDQPEALKELIDWFTSSYTDDILIYTGYRMEELLDSESEAIAEVLKKISAVVDGPYVEQLNDGVGFRGSSNQRVWVFKHEDRYRNFAQAERKVQCIVKEDGLLLIGIPGKEWE